MVWEIVLCFLYTEHLMEITVSFLKFSSSESTCMRFCISYSPVAFQLKFFHSIISESSLYVYAECNH